MMSRSTATTNTPTKNLDERIQTLEAEIDHLQQRWKPYRNVQPMRPGQQTGIGRYNPRLFLEKSELSLAIDRTQIELAQLKRQQAEQALAVYEASGNLSSAETAYREAEVAYEEAKRALQAADMERGQAQQTLGLCQERHGHLTRAVAQHEAEERRWSRELERDREMQDYVGGKADRSIEKVA